MFGSPLPPSGGSSSSSPLYSPASIIDDPLGIAAVQHGDDLAGTNGATNMRSTFHISTAEELCQEGQLRELLLEKRVAREGLSWRAL